MFKLLSFAGIILPICSSIVLADSLTCSQIQSTTNIKSFVQAQLEYTEAQNNYWSTSCGALKPACILVPSTPDELSTIVKVLNSNNETFAVKSGGHNPNNYFASVDSGPLILMSDFNEVTYDQANNNVRIGPGQRWEDVMGALDGTSITVVGGRIGEVGVGGLLLGGGLSFLSAQYGWAVNNILQVDMVLPNGTIVTASNTSNPDLLAAIKGGGSAFGVVTAYTLQAYPIGQIWGGNLIFRDGDNTDEILSAVRNFTENYNDPKAGIIVTSELTLVNLVELWVLFLFYDGPNPPEGVFDEFLALDATINSCKTRTYADFLSANDWAVLHGSVYTIGTETTPLPPAGRQDIMKAYYNHWYNTSAALSSVSGLIASMAWQPMPKSITNIAKEKGGDLMALDDAADRIIFEFDYSYWLQLDDNKVDKAMVSLYSGMKDIVDGYVTDGSLPNVYRPLFMNDAYFRQDYWGRLNPQTKQFAQSVRESVDPNDVFQTRMGGFKLE